MVSTTPTIEEITGYLNSADLTANHVCADDTVCAMLTNFTTASEVVKELDSDLGGPKRAFWIEYLEDANKFVLRCSLFDSNTTPITHSEFVSQLIASWGEERALQHPAVTYVDGAVIEWVSTAENTWTATSSVSSPMSESLVHIKLNVIKKI